jgi:hypothetical protein
MTGTAKRLLQSAEKCELCGSNKALEVHHIIPRAAMRLEDEENLIVVCHNCHAKLTPTSLLTKCGFLKMQIKNVINGIAVNTFAKIQADEERGEIIDSIIAMDIMEDQVEKALSKVEYLFLNK